MSRLCFNCLSLFVPSSSGCKSKCLVCGDSKTLPDSYAKQCFRSDLYLMDMLEDEEEVKKDE